MKDARMLTILVLGLIFWLVPQVEATPVGTVWTYQGRLMDANSAADGEYDFTFKLFDDPNVVDSNQVGNDVNVPDVDVTDGYFTVELDFGGDVFDGDARWLEVGVRPGDSNGVYTALSPRTELTPVPYALQTRGIFVDQNRNVGIGTDSPSGPFEVGRTEPAVEALDQQQTTTGYAAGGTSQWQSFTPGISGYLTKVELNISSPLGGQSSPGTLRIYEGEGTGGALLATESITLTSGAAWKTYTFSSPALLESAVRYTLRITVPQVNISFIRFAGGDPYPGGRYSMGPEYDLVFKTHMMTTPLYESTLIVDNLGRVGIGTNSPQRKLHISDVMRIEPRSDFPSDPSDGDVCVVGESGDRHIYCYLNGDWIQLDMMPPP
jgi:hypothetical protein